MLNKSHVCSDRSQRLYHIITYLQDHVQHLLTYKLKNLCILIVALLRRNFFCSSYYNDVQNEKKMNNDDVYKRMIWQPLDSSASCTKNYSLN